MLKKISGIFLSLLLLALPVVVLLEHQNLLDWWKLRNYTPSPRIAQLASSTTMNSTGRKLFYVNHPDLETKETFHDNCTLSEQTIVLGCYVTNKGIFLYDVTDSRLVGVHEVTAAHEMLHAAYERLSSKEKTRVNDLLEKQFKSMTDERIKSTVEQYRQRDASVVSNELHSILGTEVRTLDPELETYYKRYFDDRSKIVNFSEQYESVFSDLKKQVDSYDQQLASLKNEIDKLEEQINTLGSNLESQRNSLNQLLTDNKVEQYNNSVPGFNQQVKQYNNLVSSVKTKVTQYNDIVEKRNSLATEQKSLLNAIDSRTISTK